MSKSNNDYKEMCFELLEKHCLKVLTVMKENIHKKCVFKVLEIQGRNLKNNRYKLVMEFEDLVNRLYELSGDYYNYKNSEEYSMQDIFEYGPNSIFGDKEDRRKMLLDLYDKLTYKFEKKYNDPYIYVVREARNILNHPEIFNIKNYKDKLTIMLILVWIRANFNLEELSYGKEEFFNEEEELLEIIYSKKGNAKVKKILEKEALCHQKVLDIKRAILHEVLENNHERKPEGRIFCVYKELKKSSKEIKPEMFLGLFPCYVYESLNLKITEVDTEINRLYASVFLRLRKAYIKKSSKKTLNIKIFM